MRRHGSPRASRLASAALLALAATLAGMGGACAQLLSYDDYQARPLVAGDAMVADAPFTDGASDAATGPVRVPVRPAGAATAGGGKTVWTAIKRYYLGHLDPNGNASPGAWGHWGYDIDGVCTTAEDSTANVGTCLRHPMAARRDFLMDGLRCRDNNFGQHIIALLDLTSSGFEEKLNSGVLAGTSTWVFRLDDVAAAGDDPYVPGRLYRVQIEKGTPQAPKWDGTDVRRAIADSLVGRNLETPVAVFPKGFIANDVWVSGEPTPQKLVLSADSRITLALDVDSTVFTLDFDSTHTTVSSGVLSGVMPIATVESVIGPAASAAGICKDNGLYASILEKIRSYPDVSVGAPSLQDVTKQCDGISMGMGFTFAPIQPITTIAEPEPSKPGICDDAGVDAGPDAPSGGG